MKNRLYLIIKVNTVLVLILFSAALVCAKSDKKNAIRQRIAFDSDWLFALGNACDASEDFNNGTSYFSYLAKAGFGDGAAAPGFDDRAWRNQNLPHDWCVELPFDSTAGHSHGYKALGRDFPENSIGWYRKKFIIPKDDFGRNISIEFDGVYRNSVVWVNGFYLGTEESGCTSFAYDITDYLHYGGTNVIAVRVDATMEEGWFYEGAGIYRHVWLTKTSPLHVDRYGTFIKTGFANGKAEVTIQTTIVNESDKTVSFGIEENIIDEKGKSVSTGSLKNLQIGSGASGEFTTSYKVDNPKLWSLESPTLHQLQTVIRSNGKVVDKYETTFGIRTIRFDPDSGFFLNDKNVKILGTNNHQDHAGVGAAIPDALQDFRIRRLKKMGSNAIRTSHNPPTPELLDACDRLGMLVLNENRLMGTNKEHLSLLEQFIKRDRNHPSIIIWSLGNEEWAIELDDLGIRITKTMQDFAHRLDSTRPITVGLSGGWDNGIGSVTDIIGYNYIRHGDIDGHHKNFPWQPGVGTEETTASGTRGIYFTNADKAYMAQGDFTSQYGGVEFGWKYYDARQFLAGLFYWTGFDYRGEPNPYGWPQVTSQFGLMDVCGFPKDAFFYLKSWWVDEPYLQITPHWNWSEFELKQIPVSVFGNVDEVELFLNDETLGRKTMERNGHLSWDVSYSPGILSAVGYKDGSKILANKVSTTGQPAAIKMSADRNSIEADGKDIAVITVSVEDADGLTVPTASNEIYFEVEGPGKIIGVGNGDPSSHEADKFLKTIITVDITELRELPVDGFNNRDETSDNFDDSQWIPAFTNEGDWRDYKDSIIVLRGTIDLPEFNDETEVNLFTKSIVENQTIYINGHKIASDIERDDPDQSYRLTHDILKQGRNVYAVTGKRFRKTHQYDEPNRDPGLLQLIYPAEQWRRKVFNGLAQVIIQSDKDAGSIQLSASSKGIKKATIGVESR